MAFEKGHDLSTGRPKGARNKSTEIREAFARHLSDFDEKSMEWIQGIMSEDDVKARAALMKTLIEYGYTKPPQEQNININDRQEYLKSLSEAISGDADG